MRPRCEELLNGAFGRFEDEPLAPEPPPPHAVSKNANAVIAANPNLGANERFDMRLSFVPTILPDSAVS
uniref:Uncharacterized protein n=1 Tax=mine drainage metagenome TaxID=410659 RepID=E6Q3H8_9ZZZZ